MPLGFTTSAPELEWSGAHLRDCVPCKNTNMPVPAFTHNVLPLSARPIEILLAGPCAALWTQLTGAGDPLEGATVCPQATTVSPRTPAAIMLSRRMLPPIIA